MEHNVHQQIAAQERNPGHLVRSVTSIRLGVDAERADEQESEEGLAETLKAIVKRTAPNPFYSKYHALHLQRFLSKMGAYTPRCALLLICSKTAILQQHCQSPNTSASALPYGSLLDTCFASSVC